MSGGLFASLDRHTKSEHIDGEVNKCKQLRFGVWHPNLQPQFLLTKLIRHVNLAKNFETSATSMHILVNLPVGDTPTSSASTTRLSSFPNRRHTADQGKGQCQKCPSSVCPSSSTSSFSWADVQMASLFIPIRTTPKRWRENRTEGE